METFLLVCLGIGLSAACGFRIFVPPLIAGLASSGGYLDLPETAAWLGEPLTITVLAAATAIEVGAYMIPALDNLLDTIAVPMAALAGTVLASAVFGDMHPAVKWSLALIMGGGSATAVGLTTTAARAASLATTGGLANPVVSIGEGVASVVTALLAIALPLVAVILLLALLVGGWRLVSRRIPRRA